MPACTAATGRTAYLFVALRNERFVNLLVKTTVKKTIAIIVLAGACALAHAQSTITGTFPNLAGQQVRLSGFKGFDAYPIDSVVVDDEGMFVLFYGKSDYGIGTLVAADDKPFVIILSGEEIQFKGESFASAGTVEIIRGEENRLFEQYASEHGHRDQALSAWDYLEKIYRQDALFSAHGAPVQAISKEKKRIKAEDSLFLANLDPASYVRWYLPLRKLVSSVSVITQYRAQEIPATIAAFRKLDYTDPRLYKSGLLGDVIDSHFWLIENSGRSLDSVYIEMNVSIDYMFKSLTRDDKKFNEITEYLFKNLERRSLFTSSEYLASKVLNENCCTVDVRLSDRMETYRNMKTGNTAPDFEFGTDVFAPGYPEGNKPRRLSDISSRYTAVVFAASWCPACPKELVNISRLFKQWKKQGVEVVFVSLDEDKAIFREFVSPFPFISMCDYRKWGSPVAKSYHVFASPTIYLLDNKRRILLKPKSVSQLDAWVDWYLVQGKM